MRSETPVSGVILAGGQGRRMGDADKGLVRLNGRPMVAWVAERLGPQVHDLSVNANRNPADYAALGFGTFPDVIGGFAGPLAGLHAALSRARCDLVATAPCDSPFLPSDLVARLRTALDDAGADLATVRAGGRTHPVFSLCRRALLPKLEAFLRDGGRKVEAWHATLNVVHVPFDDQPDAFRNINTPADLAAIDPPGA